MPLQCARFSGDPVLEACLNGQHRILLNETGLAVKRVQAALNLLGFSVGLSGEDGIFGSATGDAVTAYKTFKGLSPNDPVVGSGTMAALDADLFSDPPALDPAFGEFSPFVAAHTLEPFVALELVAFVNAPLDSWRHMLGRFALANLQSGRLLGIVAGSRSNDLQARFLIDAAPVQADGRDAPTWFAQMTQTTNTLGLTLHFLTTVGLTHSLILISDNTILGKGTFEDRSSGRKCPIALNGAISHELTHARNIDNLGPMESTQDTDSGTYIDTALAQARTGAGPTTTARVLISFVEEMCTRHVHWAVQQELAGTPARIDQVTGEEFALAADEYFTRYADIFNDNGYITAIDTRSIQDRYRQLALWMSRCQEFSVNDDANVEARTHQLFAAAEAWFVAQSQDLEITDAQADGLFPLLKDFPP